MGHSVTHSAHGFVQGWVLFLNNAEKERTLHPCSLLKQEHNRRPLKTSNQIMSSLQLKQ